MPSRKFCPPDQMSVSAHEMLRNLRAQGTDIWSGGQNFLDGINAIGDGYSSREQQILGNADPEHLAVYLERQEQQAGGGDPAGGYEDPDEEAAYQAYKASQR